MADRRQDEPGQGERPLLMPCLMLSKGRIMLPAEGGPATARTKEGKPFDLFEVADKLIAQYGRLYVVDLDGVDHDQPELDYLQEIARGGEIWVDAGVRTADAAIDVLVAGAQRAILSTAFLRSERELRRAWRLSSDLVFELEVRKGLVAGPTLEWAGRRPEEVAAGIRDAGPRELVLSYRESDIDWTVARAIAQDGPLWVDGPFEAAGAPRLIETGCRGGIFHLHQFLAEYEPTPGEPGG